jgi:hypothetical protein
MNRFRFPLGCVAGLLFISLLLAAPNLPAQQPADSIPAIPRPVDFDTIYNIGVGIPPSLVMERGAAGEAFPPLAILLAAIDSFLATQCAAELEEFQESKKGRWLAWLPTIGASYVPSLEPGQPDRLRPAISYSLGSVERNIRQSETLKAKRHAIEERCRLDAQQSKEKVWEMYQRRTLLLEQLTHQEEVFAIDTQLFDFYTTQFKEVKIPADFYLGEQRKYLDKKFALHQARLQIRMLEAEILATAHLAPIY